MSDGVEYLIKKGHSKIGFITGIPRISTTKERLDAYRDTMEKHGIFSEALIRTGTSMTSLVVEESRCASGAWLYCSGYFQQHYGD